MINSLQQNYGKKQVGFGTKITFSEDIRKAFPADQQIAVPTHSKVALLDTLLQGKMVMVPKYEYYKGEQILDHIIGGFKRQMRNPYLVNDLKLFYHELPLVS